MAKEKKATPWVSIFVLSTFMLVICICIAYYNAHIQPVSYSLPSHQASNFDNITRDFPALLRLAEGKLPGPSCITFGRARPNQTTLASKNDTSDAQDNSEDDFLDESVDNVDVLFAGLSDGRIVQLELESGNISLVVNTGKPERLLPAYSCGTYFTEQICGRPSGIAMDNDGLRILVADSYFGLLYVDPVDHHKETLIKEPFLSGVTVSPNSGLVFFTQTSSKHQRKFHRSVWLEGKGLGRVFAFDLQDMTAKKIKKGLFYPTGIVALLNSKDKENPKEEHILVAESVRARIRKLTYDRGAKAKASIFIRNLPLYPMSLEQDQKTGDIWVAGPKRNAWLDALGRWPTLRALIVAFPDFLFDMIFPPTGIAMRMTSAGKIKEILQDPSKVSHGMTSILPVYRTLEVIKAQSAQGNLEKEEENMKQDAKKKRKVEVRDEYEEEEEEEEEGQKENLIEDIIISSSTQTLYLGSWRNWFHSIPYTENNISITK